MSKFPCHKCDNETTHVLETRAHFDKFTKEHQIVRNRKCDACGSRFYTREEFIDSGRWKPELDKKEGGEN